MLLPFAPLGSARVFKERENLILTVSGTEQKVRTGLKDLILVDLLENQPVGFYLPQFLQLVDLLGGYLPSPELLLLRGDFHQPGQEAAVLDERLPLGTVPVDVLQAALAGTWLSALQSKQRPLVMPFWGFSNLHTQSETKIDWCATLLPAQQHHHRVGFSRDEAQEENVATAAVVTLQHSFPQGAVFVQGHLLGLCSHQVVHNVTASEENVN